MQIACWQYDCPVWNAIEKPFARWPLVAKSIPHWMTESKACTDTTACHPMGHSCGAGAAYNDFNIQCVNRALQLLEGIKMLRQSCLQVRVPVVPRMPARMLVIGMLNTARFEKGMPAPIVI